MNQVFMETDYQNLDTHESVRDAMLVKNLKELMLSVHYIMINYISI